jgi:hypothetical protein
VIRVPRENCNRPIDLLGHHQPSERMCQRHFAKRKQSAAAPGFGAGFIRPSVGRPHGKNQVLGTFIAAKPKPRRKLLRSHLPAVAIEKHRNRLCSSPPPLQPFEQRLFAAESFGVAARPTSASLQIFVNQGFTTILPQRIGACVRERDQHAKENIAANGRSWIARCAASRSGNRRRR